MIQGTFGSEGELFFEITLIATPNSEFTIDALFDTGFSEWMAVDKQDIDGFNWQYLGERDMRLAKGESKFDIYLGKVQVDGQVFDIPVHVGQGVSEILLGRQWLQSKRLLVDMASGILTLGN